MSILYYLLSSLPLLRAVVQSDGQGDERVFESVGGAGLGQQSATEHTPLPGEGVVQRVVGVVQYGQQFVQGPSFCHCHQRVQLCAYY